MTPDILTKPSLLPYPSRDGRPVPAFNRTSSTKNPEHNPVPISIALTKWHWILLYQDRILGIARENGKVVYNEPLPLVSA
jgi:hypothetical protein